MSIINPTTIVYRRPRAPIYLLVHPAVPLPTLAAALTLVRLRLRWSASRRQLVLESRP